MESRSLKNEQQHIFGFRLNLLSENEYSLRFILGPLELLIDLQAFNYIEVILKHK